MAITQINLRKHDNETAVKETVKQFGWNFKTGLSAAFLFYKGEALLSGIHFYYGKNPFSPLRFFVYLCYTACMDMLPFISKEQYMRFFHAGDHCSVRIGVRLLDLGQGYARAELGLSDDSRNIMGNMHGGALATLADITAGCSVIYHGRICVTLDTNIRYLKSVRSGKVLATAKEIHAGGRTCICQVDMTDEAGDLCCTATISMYLTDKPATDMLKPRSPGHA